MEIALIGHSCFKISNKSSVVITDPYDPTMVGLKLPKFDKANVVTISHDHPDHNFLQNLPEDKFVINGPGEYEVGGILINGIATFHDDENGAKRGKNTVYVITMDGLRICHLGDLGHKLSDEQLEKIGTVDIVLIPVGGFYTIDSHIASEVVVQLEPRVVIPMHFKRPGLDEKTFGQLDTAEKFLKEMGAESVTPLAKFVTSVDKLPESTTVVVLE